MKFFAVVFAAIMAVAAAVPYYGAVNYGVPVYSHAPVVTSVTSRVDSGAKILAAPVVAAPVVYGHGYGYGHGYNTLGYKGLYGHGIY